MCNLLAPDKLPTLRIHQGEGRKRGRYRGPPPRGHPPPPASCWAGTAAAAAWSSDPRSASPSLPCRSPPCAAWGSITCLVGAGASAGRHSGAGLHACPPSQPACSAPLPTRRPTHSTPPSCCLLLFFQTPWLAPTSPLWRKALSCSSAWRWAEAQGLRHGGRVRAADR